MATSREIFAFTLNGDEKNAVERVTKEHLSASLTDSKDYLIHLAVQQKMAKLVAKLIALGADPYQLNNEDENAFSLAVHHEDPTIFIQLLKTKIAPTADIGSAILIAADEDETSNEKIQTIIQKLCQKTDKKVLAEAFSMWDYDGNQAIHLAVKKRNHAVLKTLVQYGANPYALNAKKQNAVSLAVKKDDLEALTILLTSEHVATSAIGYAILAAVLEDKVNYLELLLQKAGKELAAEILAKFKIGEKKRSALHIAVKNNSPKMVALLLAFGAKAEQLDGMGLSVYSYAEHKGFSDLKASQPHEENKVKEDQSVKQIPEKILPQQFTGRYQGEYEQFLRYIKKNNFTLEDSTRLGNVALNDPQFYFEESEKSFECGITFLNAFFSNEKNCRDVVNIQNQKMAGKKENNPKALIAPSVISFLSFSLYKKNYCFVTVSDWRNLYNLNFSETINLLNNDDNEYFINRENIDIAKINILLGRVAGQRSLTKACSEKYFLLTFMKLLLEYGSEIHIDGMSSFNLYPYDYSKKYGTDTSAPLFRDINNVYPKSRIQINDRFYSRLVPCCSECQQNKEPTLAILTAAQQIGDDYNRGRSKDRTTKREFNPSPIRITGTSPDSELSRHSFFKDKKSQNVITAPADNLNNNNVSFKKNIKRRS